MDTGRAWITALQPSSSNWFSVSFICSKSMRMPRGGILVRQLCAVSKYARSMASTSGSNESVLTLHTFSLSSHPHQHPRWNQDSNNKLRRLSFFWSHPASVHTGTCLKEREGKKKKWKVRWCRNIKRTIGPLRRQRMNEEERKRRKLKLSQKHNV